MTNSETLGSDDAGMAGLLSATYHFMMSRIMDRLAAEGYQDLSKTQLHVLARFDSTGMTLSEISDRVQISVHVVSNIVKMLATEGYVSETQQGPVIGDFKYVLEHRAREALDIVSGGQREVEEEWKKFLDDEELESITESLGRLFRATIQAKQGE